MDIVGAFDVHRKQITFDYMEMETGEVHRGKIRPATRESLREWLEEFTEQFSGKQIAIAVNYPPEPWTIRRARRLSSR